MVALTSRTRFALRTSRSAGSRRWRASWSFSGSTRTRPRFGDTPRRRRGRSTAEAGARRHTRRLIAATWSGVSCQVLPGRGASSETAPTRPGGSCAPRPRVSRPRTVHSLQASCFGVVVSAATGTALADQWTGMGVRLAPIVQLEPLVDPACDPDVHVARHSAPELRSKNSRMRALVRDCGSPGTTTRSSQDRARKSSAGGRLAHGSSNKR